MKQIELEEDSFKPKGRYKNCLKSDLEIVNILQKGGKLLMKYHREKLLNVSQNFEATH